MEAVQYRETDKAFWTHFLAWQTMRANGKKKSGKGYKTAYPKFKLFWNEEAAMKNIEKNKKKPDAKQEKKQKPDKASSSTINSNNHSPLEHLFRRTFFIRTPPTLQGSQASSLHPPQNHPPTLKRSD